MAAETPDTPAPTDAERRAALEAECDELRAGSEAGRDERRPVALDQQAVGRLSRMDAIQMQAMAEAAEERRKLRLQKIGAALKRLDAGAYGECLRCGEDIEPARLKFDPAATLCAPCGRG
ncbi:MAG: TraR/DksA family transcriptional regulator [Rhodospirillales bacterium]